MHCEGRCPQCPSRNMDLGAKTVVSGDWNTDGPYNVLFVGEAPGREENNRRRVLVGRTGEEFNNTYLPLAGLSRGEVSMTNTVKCHWDDSADAPPQELVKSCSEFHLRQELARHTPDTVVLMGATANSLLDLDVEMEHGMGRLGTMLGWSGQVFSTFHPALGLHKSDKMLAMVDRLDGDFPRLKRFLRGELQPLKLDMMPVHYRRITRASEVAAVMDEALRLGSSDIAIDTESQKTWNGYRPSIRYTPWCATWAMLPGAAYMVRTVDEDAMREFGKWMRKFQRIIMHHAMHDAEVLSMTGIWTLDLWRKVHDTMSMAYDDGRLPKGLKALSYRLLAKRMTSFDDTVVPHSYKVALDYLHRASKIAWPKPVQTPTGALKHCPECKGTTVLSLGRGKMKRLYPCDCDGGFVPKLTQKKNMNYKLDLMFTAVDKGGDVDLWERWEGWETEVQPLIDRMGPLPLASIEHVPTAGAIAYACGDAHETLRVFGPLQKRLVDLRRGMAA